MGRWVKLHEKILDWELFADSHVVHVFIYLVLRANECVKVHQNNVLLRGRLAVTVAKISADTKLSAQVVRTALKRLEESGSITVYSTPGGTYITVNNYDLYQSPEEQKPDGKPAQKTASTTSQKPARRKKPSSKSTRKDVQQNPVINPSPSPKAEDTLKSQLVSDSYWTEVMCMRYHIAQKDKLRDYIDRFFIEAMCRGNAHDSLREVKNHFNSWLAIAIKYEQIEQKSNVTNNKRRGTEVPIAQVQDYKTSF